MVVPDDYIKLIKSQTDISHVFIRKLLVTAEAR